MIQRPLGHAPRALPACLVACLALAACRAEPPAELAKPEPTSAAPRATTEQPAKAAPTPAKAAPTAGKLVLGAPIEGGQRATLTEVAKSPASFAGKTLVMEGTVPAVCQHMGCWMELKDDSGQAHVKMAGHAFMVPKTASGKRARVLGKLAGNTPEPACGGEHGGGAGCKAEAEKQLGHALAKLELEAQGVELLD